MRKLILILLLLLNVLVLYADKKNIYEDFLVGYTNISYDGSIFTFDNVAGIQYHLYRLPEKVEILEYKTVLENNIPYIQDSNGNNVFLILKDTDYAVLYYYDAIQKDYIVPIFHGTSIENPNNFFLDSPKQNLISSSFLTEGTKKYNAENISSLELGSPWVEGVSGHGIGEYIQFDLKMWHRESKGDANGIYFFNGYVSFEKPYLYEYNSRIKQLKVQDINTNEEWLVDIEDTPNPQYIDFEGHEGNTIKLIINDVYPGSKWEDTCVNSIMLNYRRNDKKSLFPW